MRQSAAQPDNVPHLQSHNLLLEPHSLDFTALSASGKMPPPPAVFHALLRPAVIQILRATGFHSAKPAVIDSLTDLAARYLEIVCQETARHAGHNAHVPDYAGMVEPTIADVRLALQDVGAFLPERDWEEQDYLEQEDTRGVDDFIAWATGPKTEQIKRVALDGVEEGVTDYLTGMIYYRIVASQTEFKS